MSHIQAVVEAHRERFLAEFCEFLSYPSESSNAEGLAGAADWVTNRLANLGARVQRLSTGADAPPAIFGEVGAGTRSLFSYSHYDVQPPDPLEEWESPPYEATVRDGKLYARGAVDDKGDTLARIQAAEIYRGLRRAAAAAQVLCRGRGRGRQPPSGGAGRAPRRSAACGRRDLGGWRVRRRRALHLLLWRQRDRLSRVAHPRRGL